MARIAIIGTGIAGLGCAHFLHRHHDLTIFEANDYAGGHAHTLDAVEPGTARLVPIDTGFTTFSEDSAPLLARLFAQLQVPLHTTSVAFAVRDDLSGFEWNGASLNHLFAQRKNLLRPRLLKLFSTIRRFNKDAAAALANPATAGLTVRDHIQRRGYGEDLFNLHVAPLAHAVWNLPPEHVLDFPAQTLLRVLRDHGLLRFPARPSRSVVEGGARQYRDRLVAPFVSAIRLGLPVVRIIRNGPTRGVIVMTADGATRTFDQVIVATRADQALRLLVNPTPDEIRLLSEFKYHANVVTLHTDTSVLPRAPLARAAWNHQLVRDASGRLSPSTHCWLNALQGVSDRENFIVSVNRPDAIDAGKIIKRISRSHPILTLSALRAQDELPALNTAARGRTETYFAGGYFRHGLHEDAFHSAVQLTELLLGRSPWTDPAPPPSA